MLKIINYIVTMKSVQRNEKKRNAIKCKFSSNNGIEKEDEKSIEESKETENEQINEKSIEESKKARNEQMIIVRGKILSGIQRKYNIGLITLKQCSDQKLKVKQQFETEQMKNLKVENDKKTRIY